ncbi:MAG: thiamine-phosphate kinase [Gemmatimonadota bacterium]|nr:thiamine-phosphate kinase [Gemmatimonadota bacterium]
MATFREIGEFGFIERIGAAGLPRAAGVYCGIGDDCAVLACENHRVRLITSDLMVEGVHFVAEGSEPHWLGHKLLAVNLSDIAAMGGEPREAVVSLAIPPDLDVGFMERVYRGLRELASRYGVNVVGGDTARSTGPLVMNLTLTGEMDPERVCYRSGANPGDLIYVSGTLGDAAAGLKLAPGEAVGLSEQDREFLLCRHHRPEPRVVLGRALAASGAVTAMLDLSDGMASDLRHICRQSGVSAVIDGATIPVSPAFRRFRELSGAGTRNLAITGGEDYELLFTVAQRGRDVVEALAAGTEISCIGRIVKGDGRIFLENARGLKTELDARGFEHFSGSPAP